jgi:hypothetical protein
VGEKVRGRREEREEGYFNIETGEGRAVQNSVEHK